MKLQQVQKQKTNMRLVYAGAGALTLLVVAGLVIGFNLGNVQGVLASKNKNSLWEGKYSSDVLDKKNWKGQQIPSSSTEVTIQKGYKNAPELKANSKLAVKELKLEKGAEFTILGSMEVGDDIELKDKSELHVSGTLKVKDHLYVEKQSVFNVQKGAEVETGSDLALEGGTVKVAAGLLSIKGHLEFKKEKSYFTQTGGTVKVSKDIQLIAADKNGESILDVQGGTFAVRGTTRFFKSKSDAKGVPLVKVSGGKVNLNSLSRSSTEKGKYPCSYNFAVSDGILNFWGDAIMDSSDASSSSSSSGKEYCENASAWDKTKTYTRDKANDIIEVSYNGYSYRLKQNYWWSRGNQPDSKSKGYWLKMGKCGSDDPSYDFKKVKDWNKSKTYKRKNADEEVYVEYDGKIYRLHKTCWYTKGNQPDNTSWAWVEWYDGKGGSSSYDDVLDHSGGTIVFHKKTVRPYGFKSKNGGIVKFKDKNSTIELKGSEQYVNVVIDTNAVVKMTGDVVVTGDITNNSTSKPTGKCKFKLSGTGNQTINGDEPLEIDELEIDKSSGDVLVKQDVKVHKKVVFTSATGVVLSEKGGTNKKAQEALITFEDGATYEGAGWFEGGVRKVGDDAFVFPTGKNGRKGYISMSAPSTSSTYQAEYFTSEAPDKGDVGTGLLRVSSLEHWTLEQVSGTASVDVTLHWADGSWSQISDPSQLLIAMYDGNQWQTIGNGATTGNSTAGTIDNATTPSTFGYFTFGSNSAANALPVEFIHFEATRQSPQEVIVEWATATEENNDYFEVQRSSDGINFEVIDEIDGNGTTIYRQDYSYTDVQAPSGVTYYRLRQVDYNEVFDYSTIEMVEGAEANGRSLELVSVYPNPFNSYFKLDFDAPLDGNAQVSITNMSGNVVYQTEVDVWQGRNTFNYSEGAYLAHGYYLLAIKMNGEVVTQKVSKTN